MEESKNPLEKPSRIATHGLLLLEGTKAASAAVILCTWKSRLTRQFLQIAGPLVPPQEDADILKRLSVNAWTHRYVSPPPLIYASSHGTGRACGTPSTDFAAFLSHTEIFSKGQVYDKPSPGTTIPNDIRAEEEDVKQHTLFCLMSY